MMQQHTIHIAGGVVRNPLVRLTEPVTLDFLAGEHIAIVGPNGAGKSLLVDMLTEKYPLRDGELTYDFSPSSRKLPMTISNTLLSVILTVLPMPIITINSVGMAHGPGGCSASTRSAGRGKRRYLEAAAI